MLLVSYFITCIIYEIIFLMRKSDNVENASFPSLAGSGAGLAWHIFCKTTAVKLRPLSLKAIESRKKEKKTHYARTQQGTTEEWTRFLCFVHS